MSFNPAAPSWLLDQPGSEPDPLLQQLEDERRRRAQEQASAPMTSTPLNGGDIFAPSLPTPVQAQPPGFDDVTDTTLQNEVRDYEAQQRMAQAKAADEGTPAQTAQPTTPSRQDTGEGLKQPSSTAEGVAQWDGLITSAASQYGVPTNVIKAIMDIESGGDPGALSSAGATGLMQVMPFHFSADEDGRDPETNVMRGTKILADNFAKYGSWEKAAAAYFGAIDGDGNVTSASDGNADGYTYVDKFTAKSQAYANELQGTTPTQGPSVPGERPLDITNLRPSQSPDANPELSVDEAYAACGPAAAIVFAAMMGRAPTLKEAVDMARNIKAWDEGVGMYGLDAEVRLIQAMGGAAKVHNGFDRDVAVSELANGNPVLVNSPAGGAKPGHYGIISGYDPATDRFYFGTSTTDLKGGKPWMTMAEYEALGATGPVTGMLLVDNPLAHGPSSATAKPGPQIPRTWNPQQEQQTSPAEVGLKAAQDEREAAQRLAEGVQAQVEKSQKQALKDSEVKPTAPIPAVSTQIAPAGLPSNAGNAMDPLKPISPTGDRTPEFVARARDVDKMEQGPERDLAILNLSRDWEHAANTDAYHSDSEKYWQDLPNSAKTGITQTTDAQIAEHVRSNEEQRLQHLIETQKELAVIEPPSPVWTMTPDEYINWRRQNSLEIHSDEYQRHASMVLEAAKHDQDIPKKVQEAYGIGGDKWQKDRRTALAPLDAVAHGAPYDGADPELRERNITNLPSTVKHTADAFYLALFGAAKSTARGIQVGLENPPETSTLVSTALGQLSGVGPAVQAGIFARDQIIKHSPDLGVGSSIGRYADHLDQIIKASPEMQSPDRAPEGLLESARYSAGFDQWNLSSFRPDRFLRNAATLAPYLLLSAATRGASNRAVAAAGAEGPAAAFAAEALSSAASTGLSSLGSYYDEATAAGMDKRAAATYGYAHAVIQSGVELGLGRGIDKLAGAVISNSPVLKKASELISRNFVGRLIKEAVEEPVKESGEEGLQQIGENIVAKISYDPGRGILDGVGEAIGTTFGPTAAGVAHPGRLSSIRTEARASAFEYSTGLDHESQKALVQNVTSVETANTFANDHFEKVKELGAERGWDQRQIDLAQFKAAVSIYGRGLEQEITSRKLTQDQAIEDPQVLKGYFALNLSKQIAGQLADRRGYEAERRANERQAGLEQAVVDRGIGTRTPVERQTDDSTPDSVPLLRAGSTADEEHQPLVDATQQFEQTSRDLRRGDMTGPNMVSEQDRLETAYNGLSEQTLQRLTEHENPTVAALARRSLQLKQNPTEPAIMDKLAPTADPLLLRSTEANNQSQLTTLNEAKNSLQSEATELMASPRFKNPNSQERRRYNAVQQEMQNLSGEIDSILQNDVDTAYTERTASEDDHAGLKGVETSRDFLTSDLTQNPAERGGSETGAAAMTTPELVQVGDVQAGGRVAQTGTRSLEQLSGAANVTIEPVMENEQPFTVRGQAVTKGTLTSQRYSPEQLTELGNKPYVRFLMQIANEAMNGTNGNGIRAYVDSLLAGKTVSVSNPRQSNVSELLAGAALVYGSNDWGQTADGNEIGDGVVIGINPHEILQFALLEYARTHTDPSEPLDIDQLSDIFAVKLIETLIHERLHDYNSQHDIVGVGKSGKLEEKDPHKAPWFGPLLKELLVQIKSPTGPLAQLREDTAESLAGILGDPHARSEFSQDATALRQGQAIQSSDSRVGSGVGEDLRGVDADNVNVGRGPPGSADDSAGDSGRGRPGLFARGVQPGDGASARVTESQGTDGLGSAESAPATGEPGVESRATESAGPRTATSVTTDPQLPRRLVTELRTSIGNADPSRNLATRPAKWAKSLRDYYETRGGLGQFSPRAIRWQLGFAAGTPQDRLAEAILQNLYPGQDVTSRAPIEYFASLVKEEINANPDPENLWNAGTIQQFAPLGIENLPDRADIAARIERQLKADGYIRDEREVAPDQRQAETPVADVAQGPARETTTPDPDSREQRDAAQARREAKAAPTVDAYAPLSTLDSDDELLKLTQAGAGRRLGQDLQRSVVVENDKDATNENRANIASKLEARIRKLERQRERKQISADGRKLLTILREVRRGFGTSPKSYNPLSNFMDSGSVDRDGSARPLVRFRQTQEGATEAIVRRLGVMEIQATNAKERNAWKQAMKVVAESVGKLKRSQFVDHDGEVITMSEHMGRAIELMYHDSHVTHERFMSDMEQVAAEIMKGPDISLTMPQTMGVLLQAYNMMAQDAFESIMEAKVQQDGLGVGQGERGPDGKFTSFAPQTDAALEGLSKLLEASYILPSVTNLATAAGRTLRAMQFSYERLQARQDIQALDDMTDRLGQMKRIAEAAQKEIEAAIAAGGQRENELMEHVMQFGNGGTGNGSISTVQFLKAVSEAGGLGAFLRSSIQSIQSAEQLSNVYGIKPGDQGEAYLPKAMLLTLQKMRDAEAASGQPTSIEDLQPLIDEVVKSLETGSYGRRLKDRRPGTDGKSIQAEAKARWRSDGENFLIELKTAQLIRMKRKGLDQLQSQLEAGIELGTEQGWMTGSDPKLQARYVFLEQQLSRLLDWKRNTSRSNGLLRGGATTDPDMTGNTQYELGELYRDEMALDDQRERITKLIGQLKTSPGSMTQAELNGVVNNLRTVLDSQDALREQLNDKRAEVEAQVLIDLLPTMQERFEKSDIKRDAHEEALDDAALELELTMRLGLAAQERVDKQLMREALGNRDIGRVDRHLREVMREHQSDVYSEKAEVEYLIKFLGDIRKEYGDSQDLRVQLQIESIQNQAYEAVRSLNLHPQFGEQAAQGLLRQLTSVVYGNSGTLAQSIQQLVVGDGFLINGTTHPLESDRNALRGRELLDRLVGSIGDQRTDDEKIAGNTYSDYRGPLQKALEDRTDADAQAELLALLEEIANEAPGGLGDAFREQLLQAVSLEHRRSMVLDLLPMVEQSPHDAAVRQIVELTLQNLHGTIQDNEINPWFQRRYGSLEVALRRKYEAAVTRGVNKLAAAIEKMASAANDYDALVNAGVATDKDAERAASGKGPKNVSEEIAKRIEVAEAERLKKRIVATTRMIWQESDYGVRMTMEAERDADLARLETVGLHTNIETGTEEGIGLTYHQALTERINMMEDSELSRAMKRQAENEEDFDIGKLMSSLNLVHHVLYGTVGQKAKLSQREQRELQRLRDDWSSGTAMSPAEEEALFKYFARGVDRTQDETDHLEQLMQDAILDLSSIGAHEADNGVVEGIGLAKLRDLAGTFEARETGWNDRLQIAEVQQKISMRLKMIWQSNDPLFRQNQQREINRQIEYLKMQAFVLDPASPDWSKRYGRYERAIERLQDQVEDRTVSELGRADVSQQRMDLRTEVALRISEIRQLHALSMQGFEGAEAAQIQQELSDRLADLAAVGATSTDAKLQEIGPKAADKLIKDLAIREVRLDERDDERKQRRVANEAIQELQKEANALVRELATNPFNKVAEGQLADLFSMLDQYGYWKTVTQQQVEKNSTLFPNAITKKTEERIQTWVPLGTQTADRMRDTVFMRAGTSLEDLKTAAASGTDVKDEQSDILQALSDRLTTLTTTARSSNALGHLKTEIAGILADMEKVGVRGVAARTKYTARLRSTGYTRAMVQSDEAARERLTAFYATIIPGANGYDLKGVGRAMRLITAPNWATYYKEFGLVAMLSSPTTWGPLGVNAFGQVGSALLVPARWALKVPIDYAKSKITGQERTTYASEAGAALGALTPQLMLSAAKSAGQIWLHGRSQSQVEEMANTGDMSSMRAEYLVAHSDPSNFNPKDGASQAVLHYLMRVINPLLTGAHMISLRPMKVLDEFVGTLAWQAAYEAQLERKAKQTGQSREFIRRNIDRYSDVVTSAGHVQKNILYQDKDAGLSFINTIASALTQQGNGRAQPSRLRQLADVILTTYLPFTTVPYNSLKQSLELSQVGVVAYTGLAILDSARGRGTLASGERQVAAEQGITLETLRKTYDPKQTMAKAQAIKESARISDFLSKAALGAIVQTLGYALAGMGMITGDEPDDPDERSMDEAERRTPRSIYIKYPWMEKGRWYSYDNTPLAIPFSVAGNYADQMAKAQRDLAKDPKKMSWGDATADRAVAIGKATAGGTFQSVTHNFFLENLVQGMSTALSLDTTMTTDKMIYGATSPFITRHTPAILAYFAKLGDDYERDTRGDGWADRASNLFASRVPGMRQELAVKTDVDGKAVPQKQPFAAGLFAYSKSGGEVEPNPMFNVLEKYEIKKLSAPKELTSLGTSKGPFDITLDEQRAWQKVFGANVYREVREAYNRVNFTDVPPVMPGQDPKVELFRAQKAKIEAAVQRARDTAASTVRGTLDPSDINQRVAEKRRKSSVTVDQARP